MAPPAGSSRPGQFARRSKASASSSSAGRLQLRIEREHEVAAGAGFLLAFGSEDAAAVIGQLDGRAAPAAELRFVLPFHARAAHQVAGAILVGRRGLRRGRSQIAEHVGGQRAGRIGPPRVPGRSSRRDICQDRSRFARQPRATHRRP